MCNLSDSFAEFSDEAIRGIQEAWYLSIDGGKKVMIPFNYNEHLVEQLKDEANAIMHDIKMLMHQIKRKHCGLSEKDNENYWKQYWAYYYANR
jgi:hypothetical protein